MFLEERKPVLHDFSLKLGFQNPHEILINPVAFLEPINHWLSEFILEAVDNTLTTAG